MSSVIPSSLEPPANRKQRRADKAKSRHESEAKSAPVLTLLQGRQMQTPRREPELADDADEFEDPAPKPVSFAEAHPVAAEILAGTKITIVEPEADEFYEELAREEAAASVPVSEDDAEESVYVPPISAPAKLAAPVVEAEAPAVEAPVTAEAAPVVETAVEPSQPVEAVIQAAQEPEQPVKAAFGQRLVAAIRRVVLATVALVNWVDWVAVSTLAAIPVMILAAYAYGAVTTAVGIAVVALVGTVVRLIGTAALVCWLVGNRSKYLKMLFEASLVLGIGALLLVAQGSVWQALVGSLVFYLFATRRKVSA